MFTRLRRGHSPSPTRAGARGATISHRIHGAARWLSGERGQGLVEYALIITLIAMVVVGALIVLGANTNHLYGSINNCVSNAANGSGC